MKLSQIHTRFIPEIIPEHHPQPLPPLKGE